MSEQVEILDKDTLPCGCIVGTAIVDGVKTMFMDPCSETCNYYAFLITEGRKAGKPIDHRAAL